jgi:hypothetical protein
MIRSEMSQPFKKWKEAVGRGIPFYLLVPRGLKESAQKLAGDASVPVAVFTSTRCERFMSGALIGSLFNDSERFFVPLFQRWNRDEFPEASSPNQGPPDQAISVEVVGYANPALVILYGREQGSGRACTLLVH